MSRPSDNASSPVSLQPFAAAIAAFGLLNGMFSPILLFNARQAVLTVAPGILVSSPSIVYYLASLLGALFTIIVSGVPAALYERMRGHQASTLVSMWIWVAVIAYLSLPAIMAFMQIGF
jgi:hypothetical protein